MFKVVVYALLLGAAVVGVTYLAVESETFHDERDDRPHRPTIKVMHAARGGSKEDYIAHLKRTEKDNDERARRIKAVENMKQWP